MTIRLAGFTRDDEADAAYATLSSGTVARTEQVSEGILVDFDAEGRVLGLEVLGLKARLGSADVSSYLQGLAEGALSVRAIAAE